MAGSELTGSERRRVFRETVQTMIAQMDNILFDEAYFDRTNDAYLTGVVILPCRKDPTIGELEKLANFCAELASLYSGAGYEVYRIEYICRNDIQDSEFAITDERRARNSLGYSFRIIRGNRPEEKLDVGGVSGIIYIDGRDERVLDSFAGYLKRTARKDQCL